MDTKFKAFLIDEIRDHISQLCELAIEEDPNGDRIEYHREKAEKALELLKEGTEV